MLSIKELLGSEFLGNHDQNIYPAIVSVESGSRQSVDKCHNFVVDATCLIALIEYI